MSESVDEALRALERAVARGEPGAAAGLERLLRQLGRGADADRVARSVEPREESGPPLVVLPSSGETSAVVAVERTGLRELHELPFTNLPPGLATSPPFVLGIPYQRTNQGEVHVCGAFDGAPVEGSPFPFPPGFAGVCVARVGRALFVGGCTVDDDAASAMLLVRDLEAPAAPWEALPLPRYFQHVHKAFDALVVIGPRLIAVDNCVRPHVLVEYELVPGVLAPRLIRSIAVDERTLADHVVAAAAGEGLFAVVARQSAAGMSQRDASSVALLDATTWQEVAFVRASVLRGEPSMQPLPTYCAAAIGHGFVAVAASEAGLGLIELAPELEAAARAGPRVLPPPPPPPGGRGALARLGRWITGREEYDEWAPVARRRPPITPRFVPIGLREGERCVDVRYASGGLFVAALESGFVRRRGDDLMRWTDAPPGTVRMRHVVYDATR